MNAFTWLSVNFGDGKIAKPFRLNMAPLCQRVMREQLETLKQNRSEDAKNMIREQVSLCLHNLSLDPARRDKNDSRCPESWD